MEILLLLAPLKGSKSMSSKHKILGITLYLSARRGWFGSFFQLSFKIQSTGYRERYVASCVSTTGGRKEGREGKRES